jgi:hypothetical protein
MLPTSTLEARVNIAALLVDRGANLEANKLHGMTPLQFIDSAAHKERLLVCSVSLFLFSNLRFVHFLGSSG